MEKLSNFITELLISSGSESKPGCERACDF